MTAGRRWAWSSLHDRGLTLPVVERWLDLAHTAFVLVGVFAFSVSGALQAVEKRMDVVGLGSLAAVTGVGGGILRDLLIGAVPPEALRDMSLLGVSFLGAVLVFAAHGRVRLPRRPMLVFDALGLGLFCVEGTTKGMAYGLNPYAAAIVGALTGVGGGVLRDVLAGEVPSVFRQGSRLYVVPALAGAGVTAGLLSAQIWSVGLLVLIAAGVSAVRIASLRFHWAAISPKPLNEV